MTARPLVRFLAALAVALCAGCNDTPSDLRPWRPSDHDHTENPNSEQVQVTDAGSAEAGHGLDDVTVVAWQQNCTSCHGPLGRGDGPQGALLHAPDLSRSDFQTSTSDEVIAATIRQGRGKMPAFPLPEATIARLVQLIRMLDINRMQRATANSAAAAPKAPTSAAASPARVNQAAR